jgi:hypothetical protein
MNTYSIPRGIRTQQEYFDYVGEFLLEKMNHPARPIYNPFLTAHY